MKNLLQDVRYELRVLWKSKSFSAVALVTLALGIGANTAIFSVVNGLLLRPLPYRDASRLAIIWTHSPGANVAQDWPSPGQFSAIKSQTSVFEGMALDQGARYNIAGDATPEVVGVARVAAGLHHPSDIIGSAALGLALDALVWFLLLPRILTMRTER